MTEVVNCHSERSEESCFPSFLSAIPPGKILPCPQDDKMKADRFAKEARDDGMNLSLTVAFLIRTSVL